MNVGFIGLGAMGLSMARNLQRAGHLVFVNDVNRERATDALAEGAVWADTPADAARNAELCFTCVPGPAEVEMVALRENGLLSAMRPGTSWFDFTTNSPTSVRAMQEVFGRKQINVMDAPISGGPRGALAASLTYWVGGHRQVFDRHFSILKIMGDQPIYVGPSGSGCVVKLIHNCAGSMIQQCLAEAFTLGVKAGVDPAILFGALREGTNGRSRTFDRLSEQFLSGNYVPPSFSLRLARKDMDLALTMARDLQVSMPMGDRTMEDIVEAVGRGWSEHDARIAMHLKEERASVSARVQLEELDRIMRTS